MNAAAEKPDRVSLTQARCEPGDIGDHIALSATAYSDPRTTDAGHLRWKFLACPGQPCWTTAFHAGGRMVGRAMRMDRPLLMSASESALRSASISDLLLAPEFRRPDLMIRLVRAGSDMADLDVILHGSNESSLPIYEKLFKYPVAFSLTAKGFPLRAARPLRKLTGRDLPVLDALTAPWRGLARLAGAVAGRFARLTLTPGDLSDAELAELYSRFETIAGPHLRRSVAFARWRFRDGPLFNARLLRIESAGALIGYVALRDVSHDGLNLCVVIDLALSRPLGALERLALSLAIANAGGPDADAVVTLANFDNPLLRGSLGLPLIPLKDAWLPHANPIFALVKTDRERRLAMLAPTFMTLADLDYF